MSGEQWTVSDDAAFDFATKGQQHPSFTAMALMSVMAHPADHVDALHSVVTPESTPAWGDFSETAAMLEEFGNWGVGPVTAAAERAPDVAYVRILRGVTATYQQQGDALIEVSAVITLTWRPEVGFWLVHGIGPAFLPADLPSTSAGIAAAWSARYAHEQSAAYFAPCLETRFSPRVSLDLGGFHSLGGLHS